MGEENVAIHTSKCPFCGNEVNLFIFYKDQIVGCKYCGVHIPKKTNADRIRAMTDEELGTFLWTIDNMYGKDHNEWLNWVKEEVADVHWDE